VLVSLCEWLVAHAGTGKLVDCYRAELGAAKAAVAWRSVPPSPWWPEVAP
jgi:hypothetical protein